MEERLDKILASAGIGTRSEVKKYLKNGRVTVNGQIERRGERKLDPAETTLCFDGALVCPESGVCYLIYKPAGCVTATEDAREKTVMDYLDVPGKQRLFPVGRLDKDTEGLLLITDDGQLAHRLLTPKRHVPKTYFAVVSGIVGENAVGTFAAGLDIGDEKPTLPAKLEILRTDEEKNVSETLVTVCEGRFHQVKRMFLALGHEVTYLKRLSMGGLTLDPAMQPGEYRKLTPQERERLEKMPADVQRPLTCEHDVGIDLSTLESYI